MLLQQKTPLLVTSQTIVMMMNLLRPNLLRLKAKKNLRRRKKNLRRRKKKLVVLLVLELEQTHVHKLLKVLTLTPDSKALQLAAKTLHLVVIESKFLM